MRIMRFADLLERKYNLKSQANLVLTPEIKRDLTRAFNHYVNANSPTIAEPILQMLADSGEPVSASIIKNMQEVIANLDNPNTEKIAKLLVNVANAITPESKASVISFIEDNTKATTEAQRNYRKRLKSKFDTVTRPLVSIVSAIVGKQILLPQKRMELSKEKLLMFSRTLAAEKYGFDSLDVLGELLKYPETREKLTTLINAIDRGHIPRDGSEIIRETALIKDLFDQRKTNEEMFNSPEDTFKETSKVLSDPGEQWSKEMQDQKKIKTPEPEEEAAQNPTFKTEPLNQKTEEARLLKQIEEDRDYHVHSEGSILLRKNLLKRYL